jgi:hypothetical protein
MKVFAPKRVNNIRAEAFPEYSGTQELISAGPRLVGKHNVAEGLWKGDEDSEEVLFHNVIESGLTGIAIGIHWCTPG